MKNQFIVHVNYSVHVHVCNQSVFVCFFGTSKPLGLSILFDAQMECMAVYVYMYIYMYEHKVIQFVLFRFIQANRNLMLRSWVLFSLA